MRNQVEAIRMTIMDPSRVFYDAVHPEREVFYRLGMIHGAERHWLKACVAFRQRLSGQSEGVVVTAYPTSRQKPGELQKWP